MGGGGRSAEMTRFLHFWKGGACPCIFSSKMQKSLHVCAYSGVSLSTFEIVDHFFCNLA